MSPVIGDTHNDKHYSYLFIYLHYAAKSQNTQHNKHIVVQLLLRILKTELHPLVIRLLDF